MKLIIKGERGRASFFRPKGNLCCSEGRTNLPARLKSYLVGFLPMVILISCVKEKTYVPEPVGNGETIVKFAVQSPAAASPKVRSLTETGENDVQAIDVLVFGPGGGTYMYTASCDASDITTGGDSRLKLFTIKLRMGNFDLVILANARDIITASTFEDLTKAEALASLEAALPTGGKWPADGSRLFPMWGDIGTITIDDDTELTGSRKVKIHRMMARIDVNVTESAAANFQLTSIDIYNYNTKGNLVPDMATWDTADPDRPKATAPNVPASSVLTLGPVGYQGTEINATLNNCVREIYLFEAENHTDATHGEAKGLLNRTCLVIGGVWDANGDGDFTNDGAPTYYRADFSTGNGTSQVFIDVNRNHQYIFNVTKVSGYGYDDSHTAFISGPVNIETEVVAWNEAGMNDIESDGQYQLTVDKNSFLFHGGGRPQTMKIYTDHPLGWKIDPATMPSWLTITPDSDNSASAVEVTVAAEPIPVGTDKRQASFWIRAGAIRKEIKVEQIEKPEAADIGITPTTMTFTKSAANPKTVTVTVYPETSTVYFVETPGPNPISNWALFPTSGQTYVAQYDFQPDPNNSNDILSSFVTIFILDDEGNPVSKQLTIIQLATDFLFEVTKPLTYPYNAGTYSFEIKSSTDWQIYEVVEPADQTQLVTDWSNESVNPTNTDPVTYPFVLTRNDTWEKRTALFKIRSSNENFMGYDIDITQESVPPSLTLSSTGINFNNTTSTSPQSVNVTSNAKWKYTVRDATAWSNTVQPGSESPGAGTANGSHTYHTTTQSSVSFAPRSYPAADGTPAAGSTFTAYADFTTTDHAGAPAATGVITLSRRVPSWFTYTRVQPGSLSKGANTVRVTVNTNSTWSLTSNMGTSASRSTTRAWGSDYLDINIPANDSWAGRVVTVSFSGTDNNSPVSGMALSVSQPSHTNNTPTLSPTTIPADGTTVTVTVTGDYPQGYIQVQATGTSLSVSGTTNASQRVVLSIPSNNTGNDRAISFQYRRLINGSWGSWINISTIWQTKAGATLTSGRIIAKNDVGDVLAWTSAMGISATYGTTFFNNPVNYTPSMSVGCGGYSETSTDLRYWKLPTDSELQEMYYQKDLIGNLRSGVYWSSLENYANYAWTVDMTNGARSSQPKTTGKYRVRCVRSP